MWAYLEDTRKAYERTSFVGYATTFSVLFYGLVSYFILKFTSRDQPFFSEFEYLHEIFWALAFVIVVGIVVISRMSLRRISKVELSPDRVVKCLQARSMVIFAMCEGIGVLGLILSLLTRTMLDYYGFAFVSLLSFRLFFPKLHQWEDLVQQTISRLEV